MRRLGAALGLLLVIVAGSAGAATWADLTHGEWLAHPSDWGDGVVYGMMEIILGGGTGLVVHCSGALSAATVQAVLRSTPPIVEPARPLAIAVASAVGRLGCTAQRQ